MIITNTLSKELMNECGNGAYVSVHYVWLILSITNNGIIITLSAVSMYS